MTNKEFLTEVQHRSGLDRQLCSVLMQSAIKLMAENATEQIAVEWDGIGHFLATKHPEYVSEDPDSGLQTMYPPRISYRLSQQMPGVNVRELNATQFSFHLARYAKSAEVDAEFFMHTVTKLILERLDDNDPVEIQGLGTFVWVESQQGRRMSLQVDDKMRSMVNAPFSCFEPVVVAMESKLKTASDNQEHLESPGSSETLETSDSLETSESLESHELQVDLVGQETSGDTSQPEAQLEVQPDTQTAVHEAQSEPQSEQPAVLASQSPTHTTQPEWLATQRTSVAAFWTKLNTLPKSYLYGGVAGVLFLLVLVVWLLMPSKASEQSPVEPLSSNQVVADSTGVHESSDSLDSLEPSVKPAVPANPASPKPTANQETTGSQVTSAPSARPTNDMLLLENGTPVMDKLGDGGRLTLVALRHYGDKAFWAYIYDVNSFQLNDPNNVPIGLPLYLPDPKYFRIDASDPGSIKRAQNRAMQILNSKK